MLPFSLQVINFETVFLKWNRQYETSKNYANTCTILGQTNKQPMQG